MKLFNFTREITETARRVFANSSTGKVSTGSRTSLPQDSVPRGGSLVVRNDPSSTAPVMVGGSDEGSLDFKLKAGESVSLAVSDASQVDVKPNSGTQTVRYITESE